MTWDAMQSVAATMQSDAEAVRVISQNIANAQTPAYRREISLSRTTFAALSAGTQAPDVTPAIDRTPGTLQNTGEPLHVAVEGSGFFVISTDHGELLTRRGDFRLDTNGQLVTHSGAAVLGAKGPITLDTGSPAIDADGTIHVGDTIIDKLRVAAVGADTVLQPAGDDAYTVADGEQGPPDAAAALVRQGFLETSNVQSVNEMVQLMDTMRRFEAAQHFVRGYDSMTDEAIKTLGKI